MPIYEYKALTEDGKAASGTVTADTPKDARDQLRGRNIHVTEIVEVGAKKKTVGGLSLRQRGGRRLQAITMLTRQFATLLDAGIPVTQVLTALIEQSENKDIERVLRDVREKVTQGSTVAEALENHPHYFSDLFVSMVRAGEASGNLPAVLGRLADYTQRQSRLRNKVRTALAYPMIMIIIMVMVVALLMIVVIPKIQTLLIQTGRELPVPTKVLIAVSDFARSYWFFMALGAIALYMVYKFIQKTEKGKFFFDTHKFGVPLVGKLMKKQCISRFATTFATLLQSGIPVLDCLVIVKDVVDNSFLARTIETVRSNILEGTDVATPIKKSGVFPPVVGYMIAVGEESGQLEDMLSRIADAYDEEVEQTTEQVTAIMEPLIIVFMAVVVGSIILAIVLPLLELGQVH